MFKLLKPGNIRCMLEIDSTTVGTKTMAKLDGEITPILAELITLGSENYNEHPTIKMLFNWLVAPGRKGEEFYYVVGPLQEYVFSVMMFHFKQYLDPKGYAGIPGRHLGMIAVEAMAVICPVLEGPWEQAAWVLLLESTSMSSEDYGFASERVAVWLITVIGDPALCPNPYLRVELMNLFQQLVDVEKHINLRPQALESALFACASYNIEYLIESKFQLDYYHHMDMDTLMDYLNYISMDINEKFDESLAKQLQNVKYLRLSAHVNDVAYNYARNSSKFEEPKVLQGLTAILNVINEFIQLNYKDYKQKNSNLFKNFTGINNTSHWLMIFITIFTKSSWTPHLIGITATCILTALEILMSEYASTESSYGLCNIINILEVMFDEKLFKPEIESPENMTVLVKYIERLNNIKINYC